LPAEDFREAAFPGNGLRESGFPPKGFREDGLPPKGFRPAGLPAAAFLAGGFSLKNLRGAFSAGAFFSVGLRLAALCAGPFRRARFRSTGAFASRAGAASNRGFSGWRL
jgi:hypothetical protein